RKKKALEKEAKAKQNEIKKVEDEISKNEEKLGMLQEDLCKEEIYSNPSESERVNKEIKNVQEIISQLYEKWEELSLDE
ncbi:ABC transporter C-terminal domain-containing protein, partial [uncultured Clostridium sp.]|uniref:ABC transporter C-terminal domain-containing protein n=1 Tax=uncultured Clostridium sp. TaxID=59620 RepID=UPI0025E96D0B